MPQHGGYGFIAFLEQYLRHVQRCAPLCFQYQVLKTIWRNGGDCLVQWFFLILCAF
jgi:hypothetical protein